MTDFCVGPQTMARIARNSALMERMGVRFGGATSATGSPDPTLWTEARLRCLNCRLTQWCARYLDGDEAASASSTPSFCANRSYFEQQGDGVYRRSE